MKDVELTGVGFTQESIPAFTFSVELEEGQDLDGTFDIAFGLAEIDDKYRLIVLGETTENILGQVSEPDSIDVVNSLLDVGKYIVFINYENTVYRETSDTVVVPLLGRVRGKEYDWVEETELPDSFVSKLHQMKEKLEMKTDPSS